jgi:hypothetical protein
MGCVALCMMSEGISAYDVSVLSSTSWRAEGGYFNDVATLSLPSNSAASLLSWKNTDNENPTLDQVIRYTYEPTTGDTTWYDYHAENIYSFSAATGVWDEVVGNDSWIYSALQKRWTQAAGGSAIWEFSSATGCFVYNPSGAAVLWRWEADTGLWRHIISDSTWRYNFVTTTWAEISNPEDVMLAIKPPLPLVQQMYAMMVMDAFFKAGVMAESGKTDWTVGAAVAGVVPCVNSVDDWSALYNATVFNSLIEGRLLGPAEYTQGRVVCSYDPDSGSFMWQRTIHPLWTEEWEFVGDNALWHDRQTGDIWEYDFESKEWNQDGGDTWRYNSETDRWYQNTDEAVWRYFPATGYWEHTADAVTWRYRFFHLSSSWLQITAHAQAPATGLPPLVVVYKAIIDTVYEAFRLSGALEVGMPTHWSVFSLSNEVWRAENATATQTLSYIPYLDTVVWQGASTDEVFHYTMKSGSWIWRNAIDPDDVYTSEYNGLTGAWFKNGSDLAAWIFNPVAGTWSDQASDRVWQQNNAWDMWTNSETDVTWHYSSDTATWTENEHNSVWKYCTTGHFWKKVSGDGSGITHETDMPALPLVEQMYIQQSVYAVLTQGREVASGNRIELELTEVEGEDDTVQWHQRGQSLIVYMRGENDPFIEYARDDDRFTWSINPDTGEWSATQGISGDVISWSFDPVTHKWTGGVGDDDSWTLSAAIRNAGTWTHDADETEVWQYEHESQRWYDAAHAVWWSYNPEQQVWIDVAGSTVWRYYWPLGVWQQLYGVASDSVVKPPMVVVQAAHISGFLDAVAYAGHLTVGDIAGISFEKQEDGTWLGDTESHTFLFTFDARSIESPLTASLDTENHAEWLAERIRVSIAPGGFWRWEVSANPFAPEIYTYDPVTSVWHIAGAAHGEVWEYDSLACVWTNQDDLDQWSYSRSTELWRDVLHGVEWEYDQEIGVWTCSSLDASWRYDGVGNRWSETTDTGSVPHFPPRVVAQHALVQSLMRVVIEAGALQNSAVFEWDHTMQSWYGVDADSAGIARYDARKTYPVSWTDASGRNQVLFNQTSGAWKWRHDGVMSIFDPVYHQWKESFRTLDGGWYYSDGVTPSWTRLADETEVWQQVGSEYVWRDMLSDTLWTYDKSEGIWSTPTTTWGYHFATHAWYEISTEGELPDRLPPVPLVQQLFVTSIAASMEAFFGQPLYAGARQAVSLFEHPLYGSRPLEKNAYYGRYNSPAVLINAPVRFENVWLIHSDVSRNLGKVQLPSVTSRALPSLVGGEKAYLQNQTTGPSIILSDTTIACHESLVVAGVRVAVTERSANQIEAFGGVEDNHSSVLLYQRGRAYDGPLRRGLVFQLGSLANRMLDGTVVESLKNSYLDVYRSRETAVTESDIPTQITLSLDSAREFDVGMLDRSILTLFMAHDSNVRIGWPSPVASELYIPSTVPLTGIMSDDAGAFDPGYFGGGQLAINSTNWCLSGRTTDGMPPQLVTKNDEGAAVYVEYGGALAVVEGADVIIDTTIAARAGYSDLAGLVSIPRDQLLITPQGRLQEYGADFVHGGETSGAYTGNVRVSGEHSSLVLGKPFQATTVMPIKRLKRKRRDG